MKMPGRVLHDLHALWLLRERRDEYLGTLVNAYIAEGGRAAGVPGGVSYVDVGTFGGYRAALSLLGQAEPHYHRGSEWSPDGSAGPALRSPSKGELP